MIKPTWSVCGCAILLGTLVLASGCSDKMTAMTADDIRSDPTPELETIAATSEQRKNSVSRTVDTNLRQFNDDWDSLWLLDRPSRLSKYPVP